MIRARLFGNKKFLLLRLGIALVLLMVFLFFFKPIYFPVKPKNQVLPIALAYKFSYSNSLPTRNDLVALKYAGSSVVTLGNIVAFPGENVEIKSIVQYEVKFYINYIRLLNYRF